MNKLMIFFALGIYGGVVFGGCEEGVGKCIHVKGNKIVEQSECKIVECANINGGIQQWTFGSGKVIEITVEAIESTIEGEVEYIFGNLNINGKDGYSFDKGNRTCYGIGNGLTRNEYFCRIK